MASNTAFCGIFEFPMLKDHMTTVVSVCILLHVLCMTVLIVSTRCNVFHNHRKMMSVTPSTTIGCCVTFLAGVLIIHNI